MAKFMDRILNFLAVISGLLLIWMTLSTSINVFARYLGFRGLVWGVQFTEYAMLWMTLLGTTWLLRKDKHVTVDLITGILSEKTNVYLGLLHSVMGAAVCGVLFWYGAVVTWGQYQRKVMDIQVIDIPKYLILIIIPLGFLFLVLEFIRKFLIALKRIKAGYFTTSTGVEAIEQGGQASSEQKLKRREY